MSDKPTGGSELPTPQPTIEEYADLQWAYGFLETVNERASDLEDGDLKPVLECMRPYLLTGDDQ